MLMWIAVKLIRGSSDIYKLREAIILYINDTQSGLDQIRSRRRAIYEMWPWPDYGYIQLIYFTKCYIWGALTSLFTTGLNDSCLLQLNSTFL